MRRDIDPYAEIPLTHLHDLKAIAAGELQGFEGGSVQRRHQQLKSNKRPSVISCQAAVGLLPSDRAQRPVRSRQVR